MNHATWSAGSYSIKNWKQPGMGYTGYLNMYGRPNHHSKKRKSEKKITVVTKSSKESSPVLIKKHGQGENSPEVSRSCESTKQEMFHNYHYLDLHDESLKRSTYGAPKPSKHDQICTEEKPKMLRQMSTIGRCPSAPNLNATGVIAVHSTMAGLTALTYGMSSQERGLETQRTATKKVHSNYTEHSSPTQTKTTITKSKSHKHTVKTIKFFKETSV